MPYIIVRGNLASYDNKYPWRVLVSGLKSEDIESLRRFPCGGYCDECTIVYLQHPCVILSALEKLGYLIVASSSTSVKQDYNEYMWTMRKPTCESDCDNNKYKRYRIITGFIAAHITGSNMSHAHCCKSKANSAYSQNLNELEFERGIWSVALDGDFTRIKDFLTKGVHPDARDAAGYTALHYAARKGHLQISEFLLTHGADVNASTRAGKATALHRAAANGKAKIVELLIKNGADVTLQDIEGRTALHRAVINGHHEIGKFLTLHQSDLASIADSKGKLPTDYIDNQK